VKRCAYTSPAIADLPCPHCGRTAEESAREDAWCPACGALGASSGDRRAPVAELGGMLEEPPR